MKKRRLAMIVVLWGLLVSWLGLIYYLSMQNGEQTEKTGMYVAQRLAIYVFDEPTDVQIADFHIILRKAAHLGLFLILGSVTTWITAVTFPKVKGIFKGYYLIVSVAIIVGCGYFDEWHKQFIDGRHFDHAETMLNIQAGLLGILFAVIVMLLCHIVNFCMKEERES